MTEYLVKLSFWLPAYADFTIEAETDNEAIAKAKAQALTELESGAAPDHVEISDRYGGSIAYVDRITADGREAVAEWVQVGASPPDTLFP